VPIFTRKIGWFRLKAGKAADTNSFGGGAGLIRFAFY
jgi:hypothetical protein